MEVPGNIDFLSVRKRRSSPKSRGMVIVWKEEELPDQRGKKVQQEIEGKRQLTKLIFVKWHLKAKIILSNLSLCRV